MAWLNEDTDLLPGPRLVVMVLPSCVLSPAVAKLLSAEYQTLKFNTSEAAYVPAVVKETPVNVAFAVVTASED